MKWCCNSKEDLCRTKESLNRCCTFAFRRAPGALPKAGGSAGEEHLILQGPQLGPSSEKPEGQAGWVALKLKSNPVILQTCPFAAAPDLEPLLWSPAPRRWALPEAAPGGVGGWDPRKSWQERSWAAPGLKLFCREQLQAPPQANRAFGERGMGSGADAPFCFCFSAVQEAALRKSRSPSPRWNPLRKRSDFFIHALPLSEWSFWADTLLPLPLTP